jgi:hypothetical protein
MQDPVRLSSWLAEEARRLARGNAAVVWRREPEGQRYALQAYAPDVASLPTVPIPPAVLEELVLAGRVAPADPARLTGEGAPPPPFILLAIPLPGLEAPWGLLAIFRPASEGPFPESILPPLAAAAATAGPLLEAGTRVATLKKELATLRFKERLRDLLLEPAAEEIDLWGRLLRFLLEEVPADFAVFYRLAPDGRRLALMAAAGSGGDLEGWISVPLGRGFLGTAFERGEPVMYAATEDDLEKALFLVPVHDGRGGAPLGLILLDNAPLRTQGGEETGGFLEGVARIVEPLLPHHHQVRPISE